MSTARWSTARILYLLVGIACLCVGFWLIFG
jgi:uncharacterized membrane protein YuzA (DUF378 family)